MTFGAKADYKSAGREPTDYVNSKFILMWGWSPADGTFGTGTLAVPQGSEEEGRAHRLRRSAPHPHQPGAGRRAHLHQAVDRRRRPDRHGLCDRERGAARPGLLRPPCAGLRRGASAGGRAGRLVLQGLPDGRERRRAQDAGVGRAAVRHPGRDDPPARDRVRHRPSRRRCSAATRRAARRSASSSTAPPMRWRRSPAISASSAATPASATASPAAAASRACRRRQSDRRPGRDAAARRPAGARQGGRLSGRHQADLFGGRRSVQPGPNADKMARRSTAWSSSSCRTIS